MTDLYDLDREASSGASCFWDSKQIQEKLNVSKNTAYRLMHESGAITDKISRRIRVYVPAFVAFLTGEKEGNGDA